MAVRDFLSEFHNIHRLKDYRGVRLNFLGMSGKVYRDPKVSGSHRSWIDIVVDGNNNPGDEMRLLLTSPQTAPDLRKLRWPGLFTITVASLASGIEVDGGGVSGDRVNQFIRSLRPGIGELGYKPGMCIGVIEQNRIPYGSKKFPEWMRFHPKLQATVIASFDAKGGPLLQIVCLDPETALPVSGDEAAERIDALAKMYPEYDLASDGEKIAPGRDESRILDGAHRMAYLH